MRKDDHWNSEHELSQTLGEKVKDRKPQVLQFIGLQRVRYYLATEQQQSLLER